MQILHRGIFMPAFDRILQLARMEEMDCEFVEVTAHEGARPTHAVWQGRFYHRGGAVVHPRSASAIGLVLRYCRPVRLLSSSQSTKTKTPAGVRRVHLFWWTISHPNRTRFYSYIRQKIHLHPRFLCL